MRQERRCHPRLTLNGLKAQLTITPSLEDSIEIDGRVIDISYSGIKIRLDSPLPKDRNEGYLKIVITLPESRVPLTIHGEIKHIGSELDYGLQYIDHSPEERLDLLMFECVKFSSTDLNATIA